MAITRATNIAGLGTVFDALTDGGGLEITSGVSTFSDLNITRANVTGVSTFSDLNVTRTNVTGVSTFSDLNVTRANVTGVTTAQSLLVVGSGTTSGTADQPLQVLGGTYISGSTGIGTVSPVGRLDVRSSGGDSILNATQESRVLVGTAVSNIIGSPCGSNVAKTFVYQQAGSGEWVSAFRHDSGSAANGIFLRAGADSTTYSLYCTTIEESVPILVARGDQRLGIGTTNPADILDVSHPSPSAVTDFYFRNPAASGGARIRVIAQNSVTGILGAADSGTKIRMGSTSSHETQVICNDEVKMIVATDGQPAKVAIGTDSVPATLDFIGQQRPFTVQSHDDTTSASGSKTAIVIGQNSTVTGAISQLSFGAKSDSTYSNNNLYSAATIACAHGARTAGQYHSGNLLFFVSPGSNVAPGERMKLTDDGYLKVQSYGSSYGGGATLKCHDFTSDYNDSCVRFHTQNASYSDGMFMQRCSRAASNAYSFGFWESSNGADREFNFRGDGVAYADDSWNGGGADYAEYFEWADGNPENEDRRGMSVVLIGNKIGIATTGNSSDEIIGVISANPVVVGDVAAEKWHKKHVRDDFGSYIFDEHEVLTWYVDTDEVKTAGISTLGISTTYVQQKVQYESWNIPSDVVVPDVGVARTSYDEAGNRLRHRRVNPDWDSNVEYISRENRKEWSTVGLVGKLRVLKGQQVGDRWIKMRDISDSVEEWLIK